MYYVRLFLCDISTFLYDLVNVTLRSVLVTTGWLVLLVFYGPSTYFRSFQARPVNLATLFLGKPP